jgi:hypothetical protein
MTEANSIDRDWERPSDADDAGDPKSSTTPILWSVNVRDNEVVDLTHADLIARVRDGRLPVTTFLWRDGMEEWQALDRFPEFENLVKESRAADSGLRAIPDEEDVAPTSDNVGGPPTPRLVGPRQIQQTIPGIDSEATRAEQAERDEVSDAMTGFGILAVYERPLATLEFAPNARLNDPDEKPQSGDALTPTNPSPLRRRQGPPLPARAKKEPAKPAGAAHPPSVPPLPPRPVLRSPAAGRPATEPEPLRSEDVTAAPRPGVSTSPSADVTPAIGVAAAAVAAAKSTNDAAAPPAADVPAPPASIGPPRPAIASLPPIIVRELSVASELVATPAPVRHDESTLVLGRRRTHRWVPLRAAMVSAFGSACLASVLTWAIVRPARPSRLVADTNTARAAAAPEPALTSAAAAVAQEPPETPVLAPEKPAETGAAAAAEPAGPKSFDARAAAAESPRKKSGDARRAAAAATGAQASTGGAARRDDSGLDDDEGKPAAKPAASVASVPPAPPLTTRAGWPSNPGF